MLHIYSPDRGAVFSDLYLSLVDGEVESMLRMPSRLLFCILLHLGDKKTAKAGIFPASAPRIG